MGKRVAVIAIIIEDTEAAVQVNEIIHEYAQYVIGRMGLPYHEKKLHIISLVVDAPQDEISSLAGKIGNIKGVSTKTAYSNVSDQR